MLAETSSISETIQTTDFDGSTRRESAVDPGAFVGKRGFASKRRLAAPPDSWAAHDSVETKAPRMTV